LTGDNVSFSLANTPLAAAGLLPDAETIIQPEKRHA
jgi:hypothetical protein